MMKEFKPKLSFYELEYLVETRFMETEIKNDSVYNIVKKLTGLAKPTAKTKFDTIWENFYLPLRRSGKRVSIPFSVMKYEDDFYATFRFTGVLKISPGNDTLQKEYEELFKEALRFSPAVRDTNGEIAVKTVPYDYRGGKIKGGYVMERLMPEKEKTRLLELYEKNREKNPKTPGVSLQDYLNTAAICYRAAYPKKANGMSPLEMYNRWADGRHGGMLDIRDFNSKDEFREWRKSGKCAGAHPYEIVFSWHRHGIHIYPPDEDYEKPYYVLRVTNYAYAEDFIKMAKALVKENIPFHANEFGDVLDFLAGEKYFTVNGYEDLRFLYIPSREYKNKYFKHIQWDELKVVEFKK